MASSTYNVAPRPSPLLPLDWLLGFSLSDQALDDAPALAAGAFPASRRPLRTRASTLPSFCVLRAGTARGPIQSLMRPCSWPAPEPCLSTRYRQAGAGEKLLGQPDRAQPLPCGDSRRTSAGRLSSQDRHRRAGVGCPRADARGCPGQERLGKLPHRLHRGTRLLPRVPLLVAPDSLPLAFHPARSGCRLALLERVSRPLPRHLGLVGKPQRRAVPDLDADRK